MRKFILASFVYFLIISTVLMSGLFGISSSEMNTILYQSFSLLAIISGMFALSVYGLKGPRAFTLGLFVAGTFFWFVGDVIWSVQRRAYGEIPFPSWGDLFYLLGYPSFFLAILNEAFHANIKWREISKSLLVGMLFCAAALVAIFSYIGIFLVYSPEVSFWENFVLIGYGVGDVFLVITSFCLLVLVKEFKGGSISKAWGFLCAGLFATLIADIFYGVFPESYEAGDNITARFTDMIYTGGYLLIGWAFFAIYTSIKNLQKKVGFPR